jgi:hypothetical protein
MVNWTDIGTLIQIGKYIYLTSDRSKSNQYTHTLSKSQLALVKLMWKISKF